MNNLFQSLLISHIIFGLAGTVLAIALLIAFIKSDTALRYLRGISLSLFLSFLFAWITGGYYYVLYYGQNVRPLVKAGQTPWAHSIFMETKEHIFLILPILSAVMMIIIWFLGREEIEKIKKDLRSAAILLTVLSVAIALMGATISGAVSKSKPQNPGQIIKLFQTK